MITDIIITVCALVACYLSWRSGRSHERSKLIKGDDYPLPHPDDMNKRIALKEGDGLGGERDLKIAEIAKVTALYRAELLKGTPRAVYSHVIGLWPDPEYKQND